MYINVILVMFVIGDKDVRFYDIAFVKSPEST